MITYVILALVAAQRLGELALAQRNTRRLLAAGGHEVGGAHYPMMVAFHAAWLAGLAFLAPGLAINWYWLAIFVALQAARVWVIATLGERWTTRIIIVPHGTLVKTGPYRFLRHPNYAVVAGEIFVLPMVWGLLWYAVAFSAVHFAIIAWRIRVEENALQPLRAG